MESVPQITMTKIILLVDDEDFFRQRLARAFSKRGYKVLEAANYNEAMAAIEHESPEFATVDLKMPGKSGLKVIIDGLTLAPKLQILVLTGYGSIATATEAIKLGALHYLPKPADVDDILATFAGNYQNDIPSPTTDFPPPSLARVEWEHINRVLADCNGNISTAARKLGLHRRTLQRKLHKYAPTS